MLRIKYEMSWGQKWQDVQRKGLAEKTEPLKAEIGISPSVLAATVPFHPSVPVGTGELFALKGSHPGTPKQIILKK